MRPAAWNVRRSLDRTRWVVYPPVVRGVTSSGMAYFGTWADAMRYVSGKARKGDGQ